MTEDRPLPWRAAITVAVTILAVGAAMRVREPANIWLTTGAASVLGLGLALWAERGRLRDRIAMSPKTSWIGLGAGLALAAATHALYPLAEAWMPGLDVHVRALYEVLEDPPGIVAATPVLILVVTAEELVFRDVLVTALSRYYAAALAGALAVLLYVVPQLIGGSWLLSLVAFGCGIIWTALRLWTGGVWAAWVCHVVWDLAVFVLFPLEPLV